MILVGKNRIFLKAEGQLKSLFVVIAGSLQMLMERSRGPSYLAEAWGLARVVIRGFKNLEEKVREGEWTRLSFSIIMSHFGTLGLSVRDHK